ncbi:MAG: SAM-dependent methyltransferase [Saprospiraceae bacterium]|nr:SAM-dependent methyltransferase [Saprospiraceae bacterium]
MILYLIPLPINENDVSFIPEDVIKTLHSLKYFIVEKSRTARRYIKSTGFTGKIEELTFTELDKHNPDNINKSILQPALEGNPTGLMSEAGMPCIADPGSKIVALAHELGIKVVPLTGPSSIFLALAASGLNGQSFRFEGYLPVKEPALSKKLMLIEKSLLSENTTHIFIETPYRNKQLLDKIISSFPDNICLCIAANITTDEEYIRTNQIGKWKKSGLPDLNKINCVFLLGK